MATAKSPFPGMDPYLEARWSDVHAKLIGFMGGALQVQLPRDLRARAEERVLLEEEAKGDARRYRADVAVVDTGKPAQQQRTSATGVATVAPIVVERYEGPVIDRFIRIIDTTSGNRLVTAIEILSPWNKAPGRLCRDDDIDYTRPPDTPLDKDDAAWALSLLTR